jgi:hypothetical protein
VVLCNERRYYRFIGSTVDEHMWRTDGKKLAGKTESTLKEAYQSVFFFSLHFPT